MQKSYILGGIVANFIFTGLLFGYIVQYKPTLSSGENTPLQQSLIAAISNNRSAVVGVFSNQEMSYGTEDKQGKQTIQTQTQKYIGGSAFFIDTRGYLLTSKHVIQDASKKYSILLDDGRSFTVQKSWIDPDLDLAVLYIGQDSHQISFPVVNLVHNETILPIGQIAFTIGTPFSQYTNTVSMGIVSANGRNLQLDGGINYTGLYQLDINTNPGNSGGPVLTLQGDVFGLVTAMASQNSHLGFALPISEKSILAILANIKANDSIQSSPK
ncbi:MAG: S1C family serine protease [Candidatus Absconditabacteria bacterium]